MIIQTNWRHEEGCEIDFGAYAAGVLDELEGK
jgi:hypothetical protein